MSQMSFQTALPRNDDENSVSPNKALAGRPHHHLVRYLPVTDISDHFNPIDVGQAFPSSVKPDKTPHEYALGDRGHSPLQGGLPLASTVDLDHHSDHPYHLGPFEESFMPRLSVLSGRKDLNLRHPAPKAGALPDCATPRNGRRTNGWGEGIIGPTTLPESHGARLLSMRLSRIPFRRPNLTKPGYPLSN